MTKSSTERYFRGGEARIPRKDLAFLEVSKMGERDEDGAGEGEPQAGRAELTGPPQCHVRHRGLSVSLISSHVKPDRRMHYDVAADAHAHHRRPPIDDLKPWR